MDSFIWLVLSWTIVGTLCYLFINKLDSNRQPGTAERELKSNGTTSSTNLYSSTIPTITRSQTNDWPNIILAWLYKNFQKVPDSLDAWIKSLNEAAKKISSPATCDIFFEGFGDKFNSSNPPKISNIVIEQGPKDHLTLKSTIDISEINLKVLSSKRLDDHLIVSKYDAKITDLHGEIEARIACIANQIYMMGCFKGRPELDIQLSNTERNSSEQVNCGLVEDAIRKCLVTAVTNISLTNPSSLPSSVIPTKFTSTQLIGSDVFSPLSPSTLKPALGQTKDIFIPPTPETIKQIHHTEIKPAIIESNKLRITIIRAHLGKNRDISQPYVVVEMDEPTQKYTSNRGSSKCPCWEESFDFTLSPASEEILFEIYEGEHSVLDNDQRFLGLAIVDFEEILKSSERVHNLRLEGRPYRNDNVSGTLTVEFDFLYDTNLASRGKQIHQNVVENVNEFVRSEINEDKRPAVYDPRDSFGRHDDIKRPELNKSNVTAVKTDLNFNQNASFQVSSLLQSRRENEMSPDRDMPQSNINVRVIESIAHRNQPTMFNEENDMNYMRTNAENNLRSEDVLPQTRNSPLQQISATSEAYTHNSRDRNKKNLTSSVKRDRSFFSELRDRLSGKYIRRAKSSDIGHEFDEAVSLPSSREPSRTRQPDKKKAKSETRSVGAKSKESSRSLYQNSTLVLEMEKNNKKRHYLIPPSVLIDPAASKIFQKGRKLHIYNEHTFVAAKVKDGIDCGICHRKISKSFTKQAYECRDCRLICHKHCHYKIDGYCTHSTLKNINIIKNIDWNEFLRNYQLEEFISMDGV
ncbi:unnamed protein product [Dracunculus medinensis]|uniref:C2 domain-containing protein n=1 Tax=Dracunculus medinensis TaxID=318479 RepID=A0A0N4ULU5_DRAME|nr:unnamed protein product [Dracunculus medinensis]